MTLPKRPQLWMHRTRTFWFGLGGLLLLTALWLGVIFYDGQLRYVDPANLHRIWRADIERSNLVIQSSSTLSGYYSAGFTSQLEEPSDGGMEWWPEKILLWNDITYSPYGGTLRTHRLQLPIWPMIPLWLIAWLWWMARKDRRETAYFSSVNLPPSGAADPAEK